jgi:ATP-dependent protease ClpP protease subunit
MQYDNWTASDAIDKSLIDNDIFYLNGEISAETVAPAIKWILSANLKIKPKRTLKLYINTYGGEVYE